MADTPQKLVIDVGSGEERFEDLTGAELAEYHERQEAPDPEPTPTLDEVIVAVANELPANANAKDALRAIAKKLEGE